MRDVVKQELVAGQLKKTSTAMASFPESRWKMTEMVLRYGFIICSSACSAQGTGGCTLWISTFVPFITIDGTALYVQLDNVSILHADPRRLIVAIKAPCISCICLVLHAPDAGGHSQEAIATWWVKSTDICMPVIGADDPVICGMDCNLRATESEQGIVGDLLDREAGATPQFHMVEFCRNFNLMTANTYSEFFDVSHGTGTWKKSGSLQPIRCDYIGISHRVCAAPRSGYIDREYQTFAAHEDHRPMRFTLTVNTVISKPIHTRRRQRYDRRAVQRAATGDCPEDAI